MGLRFATIVHATFGFLLLTNATSAYRSKIYTVGTDLRMSTVTKLVFTEFQRAD